MTCCSLRRIHIWHALFRSSVWFVVALSLVLFYPSLNVCAAPPPATQPKPRALLLDDSTLTDYDDTLNAALQRTLAGAGYDTAFVSVEELRVPEALTPNRCALLVLPTARRLPALLAPLVDAYARRGGNLLVLGAPAWQSPATLLREGRWRTADEEAEATALMLPSTPLVDFRPGFPLDALIRGANHPEIATTTEIVPTGADPAAGRVAGALHVSLPDLNGWDMWRTPDLPRSPFAPGETVTIFSARGGPRTRRLALEWNERDGTRWMAVIPLTPRWRRYRLTPADFRPWDVASPERARAGFHPGNAVRLVVGLAFTHTGEIRGKQEYWLAGVGTEPDVTEDAPAKTTPSIPALETVSPGYKFSPTHSGLLRLTSPTETALVSPVRWEGIAAEELRITSSPPRPTGAGFRKWRSWRWQPLLVARDGKSGQWRGVPATLLVHKPDGGAPYAGGIWASFAIGDPVFYRDETAQKMIGEIARRMRTGLFLIDGGADCHTVLPGQKIQLGATLSNVSAQSRPATVRVTIARTPGAPPLWEKTWNMGALPARASVATPAAEWTPPTGPFPEGGYVVTAELREGSATGAGSASSNGGKGKTAGVSRSAPALGTVIDRVQHRVSLWTPSPFPQFVTVGSDGHFHLAGKLWRACGVNYTPSSGIAQEDDGMYQRWMDPAAYDPETVERDLYHIEELGFNAVSAWVYPGEATWQNLLDFLRRCRAHNLKVSLMLAPYVNVQVAEELKPLIEKFRLPENDTLFAYEIAWEPEFNGHDARRSMDDAWEKWIVKRHGSLTAAERAWGTPVPRENGKVTNPSDVALASPSGPQAHLAVDYRRFLDDWVADGYGPTIRRLHEIDVRHPVSFRMNHAGDPTNRGGMPFAFEGVARVVDFLAPEAYGRVGDWERVKPGWFTAVYARAVAPSKPVVWAEVGSSVWDALLVGPEPELVAFQGRFYEDFFRMATASGADGIFFWWFPGGYRYGEVSDYGLLNPDGTDRPAAIAVRRNAKAFLNTPPVVPDVWLSFDRDAHPDGIVGVYDALEKRFWEAVGQGRQPGLRSEPGAGAGRP